MTAPVLNTLPARIPPALTEMDRSALGLTVPPDALQVPVHTLMSANAAMPQTTLSSTAHAVSPGNSTTTALMDPALATGARDKVHLLAKKRTPPVSTPIDIDHLAKELSNHPNRKFVNNFTVGTNLLKIARDARDWSPYWTG